MIYDQGKAGTCTGCAMGNAIELITSVPVPYMEILKYYADHGVSPESGFTMTDLCETMKEDSLQGILVEDFTNIFHRFKKTSEEKKQMILSKVRTAVSRKRRGVLFGMIMRGTKNKMSIDQFGVVHPKSQSISGFHAVACVGRHLLPNGEWAFKLENSWGQDWGQRGFFFLPEKHLFTEVKNIVLIKFKISRRTHPDVE